MDWAIRTLADWATSIHLDPNEVLAREYVVLLRRGAMTYSKELMAQDLYDAIIRVRGWKLADEIVGIGEK